MENLNQIILAKCTKNAIITQLSSYGPYLGPPGLELASGTTCPLPALHRLRLILFVRTVGPP
jgi:hypothetical protein